MGAMTDPITTASDPALETALAEANLYRIRGLWSLAEQQCIAVLRKDPNNVHAHSLLGDTFFDQGRYEEAAAWYQMALDLDADSEPDRQKLQKAKELLAKQQAIKPAASGGTTGVGTQKLLGLKPSVWVNIATVVGVVFLVVCGTILLFKPTENGRPVGMPRAPASSPSASTPPGAPLPPPTAKIATASPKPVMPPVTPTPKPAKDTAHPSVASPGDMTSSLENELNHAVASDPWVRSSADVAGVQLDPQMQRVTIELIYRGPQTTVPELRSTAVWIALGAARAAFQIENPTLQQTLDSATIILDTLDAQGKPNLLLSAETSRAAIATLPPQPTLEQAFQLGFNSMRWANPPIGNTSQESAGYTGQE